MRVYTVHRRADGEVRTVKEGFSWPAFFFSALWAATRGLWLWALVAAVTIALVVALWQGGLLGDEAVAILALGLLALQAGEANDAQRRRLGRRAFVEDGVTTGRDGEAALRRWLDRHPGPAPWPGDSYGARGRAGESHAAPSLGRHPARTAP